MEDITNSFSHYYYPSSALVFYKSNSGVHDPYVEYFGMENGTPVNPHPLTVLEAKELAQALLIEQENKPLLRSDGMIEPNLLSFDAESETIVWFQKAQHRDLLFDSNLGIKSGKAAIPPMVWKADRNTLYVYALASNRKPSLNTPLYHAPFFNVYAEGAVCLGTVDVQVSETGSVNELISLWEGYFFNSYFTHLMNGHNPINGNCVLLWENLIETGHDFPMDILLKNAKQLKDIL